MSSVGRARDPGAWSLRRRLIRWIAVCAGGLLCIESVLVVWFIGYTLERELDALAVEEVAELKVASSKGRLTPADFQRLAMTLDEEHPEVRLSFRLWRELGDQLWATGGAHPSHPWPKGKVPEGTTLAPSLLIRHRTTSMTIATVTLAGDEIKERMRADLMFDGSPRAKNLEKAGAFFMLIALVGGALTVFVGVIFSARLADLLKKVAESAGTARLDESAAPAAPAKAPQEIRQVVDAFGDSVRQMRAEHSRNVLLTAGLAHELRSPLQNLISEAEVGLLRDRDAAEYRRLIRFQLEELNALALVVDNLITLTALRDTQNLPRSQRFDLAEEIRIRLGCEEGEASRRGVTIDVLERGDCAVYGDREALILMVRNLVGNAVRWTRDGTTVGLAINGRSQALQVVVEDEGPGVPPEEREAIFSAFYQGRSPNGVRAGYGLGLALARTAARSAGGDISIENTEGGGARFTVEIPRFPGSLPNDKIVGVRQLGERTSAEAAPLRSHTSSDE